MWQITTTCTYYRYAGSGAIDKIPAGTQFVEPINTSEDGKWIQIGGCATDKYNGKWVLQINAAKVTEPEPPPAVKRIARATVYFTDGTSEELVPKP